jgi:hypothetical protein
MRNFTTVTKRYNIGGDTFQCYETVEDGVTFFVPNDTANTDYQDIQEWAAIDGNNITDPGA